MRALSTISELDKKELLKDSRWLDAPDYNQSSFSKPIYNLGTCYNQNLEGLSGQNIALFVFFHKAENKAAQYLLCKRKSNKAVARNRYALPGGKADPGETILNTCLREADEELGQKITEVIPFHFMRVEKRNYFIYMIQVNQEFNPRRHDPFFKEHTMHDWAPLKRLPQRLFSETAELFKQKGTQIENIANGTAAPRRISIPELIHLRV